MNLKQFDAHSGVLSSCSSNSTLSGEKKPFLIGVAGGTASGKSTVCEKIMEEVKGLTIDRKIFSLSQDSFYKELEGEEDLENAKKGMFNFDHPDAFDFDLMLSCLRDISNGKPTKIPQYDFINARKKNHFTNVQASDVVLVEGILVFYNADVRDLFDMKLFVDTDADTRLARRVLRDTEQRSRDLETILTQYTNLVKPAFEEFCLPTKKFADVIIPRGAENTVAIKLIGEHIRDILSREPGISRSTNHRLVLAPSLSEPMGYQTGRSRHLSDVEFQQMRPH